MVNITEQIGRHMSIEITYPMMLSYDDLRVFNIIKLGSIRIVRALPNTRY